MGCIEKVKDLNHTTTMWPCYVTSLTKNLPTTKKQLKKKDWKDAMIEEYKSIMKNYIREIVPRPEGKSIVTSKWIYKIKHVVDGSIEKYKEIFVARGFS